MKLNLKLFSSLFVLAAAAGLLQAGTPSFSSGALSAKPGSCSASNPDIYFATDQPANQQEFLCTSTGWVQLNTPGPSSALTNSTTYLDVQSSIIPFLANAQTFTGLNTFSQLATFSGGIAYPLTPASPSRSIATLYHNNSSQVMFVAASITMGTTGSVYATICTDSACVNHAVEIAGSNQSGFDVPLFFIVPPGDYYEITSNTTVTVDTWMEIQ